MSFIQYLNFNSLEIFLVGGYAYSSKIKPWHWLESREAAEAMAERVATWPQKYGIDGIDLDLEDGAGDTPKAGPNMIHFVKKLRHSLYSSTALTLY